MEQKNNDIISKSYAYAFSFFALVTFFVALCLAMDDEGEWYIRNDYFAVPVAVIGIIFLGIAVSSFSKYKLRNSGLNKKLPISLLVGIILLAVCGFSLFFPPNFKVTTFDFLTGIAGFIFIVIGVSLLFKKNNGQKK